MTLRERLAIVLEQERRAIRTGDFPSLTALSEEKIALFSRLGTEEPLNTAALASLRRQAERNRLLLEAAQRGLGTALKQISSARSATTPQTYGPKGERDALGPGPQRFEKRC